MTKNLLPVNAQVVSLGGKSIRCTQEGDWILPSVYDNGLLTVVVIPYTVLLTKSGILLLLPQHMYQGCLCFTLDKPSVVKG